MRTSKLELEPRRKLHLAWAVDRISRHTEGVGIGLRIRCAEGMPVEGIEKFYLQDELRTFGDGCLLQEAEVFIEVLVVSNLAGNTWNVAEFEVAVIARRAVSRLNRTSPAIVALVLTVEGRRCLELRVVVIPSVRQTVELAVNLRIRANVRITRLQLAERINMSLACRAGKA